MRFTKIAEDAFKKLQLNAGMLLDDFDPETAEVDLTAIVGATTGGVNFKATPTFSDYGEDVDNVPNNMLEFKKLSMWEVLLSGTFVTVDAESAKRLIGAADIEGNKITPRNDLKTEDFKDIWWVGDYSDENGEQTGGFIAIHMLNALSTAGFQIQSSKDAKGQFAFEFAGHYSLENQTQVPFEVYIKGGATT